MEAERLQNKVFKLKSRVHCKEERPSGGGTITMVTVIVLEGSKESQNIPEEKGCASILKEHFN